MRTALISCAILATSPTLANTDHLLIHKSSRPAMAEASLEALIPWETPLAGFFVRSHHNVLPALVDDSWTVSFDGLVEKPTKISVKQLKAMPQVSFHAVLECSGNGRAKFNPTVSGIQWKNGAVGNAEWSGVPLKDLFKVINIQKTAVYATVSGFDEPVMPSKGKFVRSIPINLLIENNAILALRMNREPIPVAHGAPVRLVIPNIYGQNWIKWVTHITFAAEPDQRSYASKAYRMPTTAVKPGESWDPVRQGKPIEHIRVQTIITDPSHDENIPRGVTSIRGKAFSGSGPVAKVEISTDGGKTWSLAKLSPRKDYSWQEFEFPFSAMKEGTFETIARATDDKGNTQPLTQEWNPKGYLYNAADRVTFKVDRKGAELEAGRSLVAQHCLTCHSVELIDQQKLDQKSWESTIRKMSDYGLSLDDDVVKSMALALAEKPEGTSILGSEGSRLSLAENPDLLVLGGKVSGNGATGKKLFATHCAACHGDNGQGKVGPYLKGRALTDATYWSVVRHGKRTMPSFNSVLSTRQLADIREWLRKP